MPIAEHFETTDLEIIVTGATSLIGHFLLPRLKSAGHITHAFSRSRQTVPGNWHHYSGSLLSSVPPVKHANTLIHLGPLRVLPDLIDEFASIGGQRIIAFSSTSRFSKLESGNESERKMAKELIEAEEQVALKCEANNINWTLFRPTLIYGAGLDKNISSISRFIKKFGFFPLVGTGSGLRQPVHADDLAKACILSLNNKNTFNQDYDLVGGETLTYKEMVERIFMVLGKSPRFISIPLPLFRFAMRCASLLPVYSHITPDMADRMNHPLCFNSEKAKHDFGFKNRRFVPSQEDVGLKLSYARL